VTRYKGQVGVRRNEYGEMVRRKIALKIIKE